MSITNTIDTDRIVLSYVEPSILAYIKTINSDFYNMIKYILNNNKFKLTTTLINTPHFLKYYFDYIKIDKTNLLNVCVQKKLNLDGLKWLYHIKKCNPNEQTFVYAAKNGNFDILNWMFDNNFPKDANAFVCAVINDNFDILQWIFHHDFPKDKWAFAYAAFNGNFDILNWMFDNNFPKDANTFSYALQNGNLDILKWMLHNNFPYWNCDYNRYVELCKKENTKQ